jgi:hypothetical protein
LARSWAQISLSGPYCCSCEWGETMSPNCGHQRALPLKVSARHIFKFPPNSVKLGPPESYSSSAGQEIFCHLWNLKFNCRFHNSLTLDTILNQLNPNHTLAIPILKSVLIPCYKQPLCFSGIPLSGLNCSF